jgi:large subunit ribosomal protein L25
VTLKGESQAARDGAIIDHVLQDIEIRCLPADIPTELVADLSKLGKVGDSLHISDLGLDSKKHELVNNEETDTVVVASEFQEYVPDELPKEVEVLTEKKEEDTAEGAASEDKSE